MVRKSGANAAAKTKSRRETQDFDRFVEDVNNYEDEGEGDANEDDGMLEMLSMIKEFQKRKATKATSSSTVFQAKKDTLFASARRNADTAVRDGVNYIEHYKAKIADLRAQEVPQEQRTLDGSLLRGKEEAVQALMDVFTPLLEDLSYRRAEAVNESSAMLEAHSSQRQRSRKKLVNQAKSRIDQALETQRVATDATALIKYYKALLLS